MNSRSRTAPSPLPGALSVIAHDVLDLIVPVDCPGCGAPGGAPCPDCARHLVALSPRSVQIDTLAGVPTVAAGRYDDPRVRALLIAYKERGRRGLATPLAHALADAVVMAVDLAAPPVVPTKERPLVLVPMPSSRSAVRGRGHDAVGALGRRAAAVLCAEGVPAISRSLIRQGRTVRDQVGLTGVQRFTNVGGAFELRRGWGSRFAGDAPIVLIDDVTTSGATLREATRALRAAEVRVVAAATVAAARGAQVAAAR